MLDFQISKSGCVLRIVRLLRGRKQIRHVISSETPPLPARLPLAAAGLVAVAIRRSFKPSSQFFHSSQVSRLRLSLFRLYPAVGESPAKIDQPHAICAVHQDVLRLGIPPNTASQAKRVNGGLDVISLTAAERSVHAGSHVLERPEHPRTLGWNVGEQHSNQP